MTTAMFSRRIGRRGYNNCCYKSLSSVPQGSKFDHLYDHVTDVVRTGDLTFRGMLTDEFCIKGAPNGGYLMGLAMSAAKHCMSAQDPLTTTGYYVNKSVANAPMDLRVELLSVTNSTTTATVRCSQEGDLKCFFTFTYGTLSRMRGLSQNNLIPPDLPPVRQCLDAMAIMRTELGDDMSIARQIELRVPSQDEFARTTLIGQQGTVASLSGWGSFSNTVDGGPVRPLCLSSLCQLADCFPPPVLNIARFGWIPTLEYTVHYWNDPRVAEIGMNNSCVDSSNGADKDKDKISLFVAHLEGLPVDHPDHHEHWVRYTATTSYVQNSMCYLDNEIWSACGNTLLATSRQLARVMVPAKKSDRFDR